MRARYIHAICEGLLQVFKEIKEATLSEHLAKKLRKHELDLKFLVTCRYFAVYPKFAHCKIVSKILTRSRWRLKCLHSELRICPRENQNKVKEPFVKLLQQESFFVTLHHGENFGEFDPRPSLTETVIEMFFGKSCTLYDTQIITLNKLFEEVSKLKISKLSIKGILSIKARQAKQTKSNPLRYMISGIQKKKPTKNLSHFDPMVWVLSRGAEKTPLQQFLLNCFFSFDSIFSSIAWIDKLRNWDEGIWFSV